MRRPARSPPKPGSRPPASPPRRQSTSGVRRDLHAAARRDQNVTNEIRRQHRQRKTSYAGECMGGTGLEPVTPSLSTPLRGRFSPHGVPTSVGRARPFVRLLCVVRLARSRGACQPYANTSDGPEALTLAISHAPNRLRRFRQEHASAREGDRLRRKPAYPVVTPASASGGASSLTPDRRAVRGRD